MYCQVKQCDSWTPLILPYLLHKTGPAFTPEQSSCLILPYCNQKMAESKGLVFKYFLITIRKNYEIKGLVIKFS